MGRKEKTVEKMSREKAAGQRAGEARKQSGESARWSARQPGQRQSWQPKGTTPEGWQSRRRDPLGPGSRGESATPESWEQGRGTASGSLVVGRGDWEDQTLVVTSPFRPEPGDGGEKCIRITR